MNFVKRTLSMTLVLWLLSAFLYAKDPASERYRYLMLLHNKIRQQQQLLPK